MKYKHWPELLANPLTMDLPTATFQAERSDLVFYMALTVLSEICKEMIAHGNHADTPVAVVSRGTTPDQQVYVGTLATISEILDGINVVGPALIIAGDVVKVRDQSIVSRISSSADASNHREQADSEYCDARQQRSCASCEAVPRESPH